MTVYENGIMIPIGFMFLQCTQGAEDAILGQLKSISGVAYAFKLDGSYDIVVKIESESVEQFTQAIAAIRKVPNILNTDTIVGFK
jgi:nitrate reductase NapAB chaperone NapD